MLAQPSDSDRDQTKKLEIGYSDEVSVVFE